MDILNNPGCIHCQPARYVPDFDTRSQVIQIAIGSLPFLTVSHIDYLSWGGRHGHGGYAARTCPCIFGGTKVTILLFAMHAAKKPYSAVFCVWSRFPFASCSKRHWTHFEIVKEIIPLGVSHYMHTKKKKKYSVHILTQRHWQKALPQRQRQRQIYQSWIWPLEIVRL